MRDFTASTLRGLALKGITVLGTVAIAGHGEGDFVWANATRGYRLDDNGCHRIRTHAEVLEMAK